ncbi:S41 family peptidase [Nitritalea halalkaliphila]|uniref:S41 family peptidase n=1 Tax=Nitritalea halalkaliphila TaxID=590849 RepID=UPI000317317B|nr:S41 family peptidase [Nitritalea halalkaliphila]
MDLRYNGGGFTSSAVELASHIGSNVSSNDIFFRNRYNSFLEQFEQFQNVIANFTDAANNIGNQLTNNRVYIITSNRTASSSELVINGLKPFMDVFLVGDVTEGKNVGSALLRDNQNEANNWGLLPIIFKSFNADDRSDYGEGFIPNRGPINEFMELPFQALGDPEEFLLRNTIDVILGRSSTSARRNILEGRALPYSSLERHLRHGQAIDTSKDEDLKQVLPF